jgi:hypothetical protein
MAIKARWGHRQPRSYLQGSAGAGERHHSDGSAVPGWAAGPQTGGPVAARSLAAGRGSPGPLREVAAPGWRRWAYPAALAWALGYGSLRIYWALGTAPHPPPTGTDLVVFTGWWPVALCAAAAAAVTGLRRARWRPPLAVAAWGVAAALAAASALLLLDVIGIILPGIGLTLHPVAMLSRAACLAGSVLVGATALSYQRATRPPYWACGRC